MTERPDHRTPRDDEVLFLPLGGTGEIGMNLSLYGHAGSWIIVDCGITFGGDLFPGYDVMMADPAFIAARRDRLAGILLTHAHEDHVGALSYLWRRLRCPIYATPFTAALARWKLRAAGIDEAEVTEVPLGARVRLGAFDVEYIGVSHSIPEPNALLIKTGAGAVFHTGDWKLDDNPVVGRAYDRRRLQSLRREPLLAMVCDSTNAVVPGRTGSEGALLDPMTELVAGLDGRVLVTAFASNIARLITLARVAERTDRHFGVVGQAMERMIAVARATGHWPDDLPALVDARHLGYLPPSQVLAVCTGSQGEPRSALSRISRDRHRDLLLDPGDSVIFSSKLIPGNERSVERLYRRLRGLGVALITDRDAQVHCSGHPAEDDLRCLYDWVQPPALIPVHGTPRHLAANAAIAAECHVPRVQVIGNGEVCRLADTGPETVGQVPTGRLFTAADGRLLPVPEGELERMRAESSWSTRPNCPP